MTLSEDLRSELTSFEPRRTCDRLAELSALFHGAGRLHMLGRGEISLHLDLGTAAVARRAFSLLRSFGLDSELRTYRRRAFERGTRYELHVEGAGRALQVLDEAGVLSPRFGPIGCPPRRVVGRACCRGAYLRGALLAGGSLTRSGSLHLELRAQSREGADFVAQVAAADGIQLAVYERPGHAVAYAKGVDAVAGVLAAAGATDAVLGFEERAVVASTRSSANRLANADHANIVRASRAAQLQLRAVRRLQRRGRLAALPAPLREVAELRLRHPSLSLRELAQKCRPPSTKATVHRRLQKLVRLAKL